MNPEAKRKRKKEIINFTLRYLNVIIHSRRHRLEAQDGSTLRPDREFDIIKLMGYTYILECSNKTYYVGSTNNLKRRLKQHRQGKCKHTKSRNPLKLAFSKKFRTLKKARSFEYFIKQQRNQKFYQKLIDGKFEFK